MLCSLVNKLSYLCLVFQVFALAGLSSGLTEAVVINPFEVIKVKLQAERNVFAQV